MGINIRTRKKLEKARRNYFTNTRVKMAVYRISGYNMETNKCIVFDGVIKLSDNTIGALFRRHLELAALNKINLNIHPM